jgi:hypothetical protein
MLILSAVTLRNGGSRGGLVRRPAQNRCACLANKRAPELRRNAEYGAGLGGTIQQPEAVLGVLGDRARAAGLVDGKPLAWLMVISP